MMSTRIQGRRIAQNTLLNFLGQALPLILTVAVTPAVFRGLGAERFGLLALVAIIIGYLGIFDLGMSRAVTNYAAESLSRGESKRLATIVWTAAAAQAGLGIATALLFAAITPTILTHVLTVSPERVGEARASFYILSTSLPAIFVTGSFRGTLEAAQRFDILNAIGLPFNVATVAFPLIAIHFGWDIDGIVAFLAVSRVALLVVHFRLAARIFPELATPRFSHQELRALMRFGGWLTVSTVVGPIFLYADRFLIGSVLGVSAVSYYAIPYDIVTRLWIVPASLAMSLFPAFSSLGTMRIEEVTRYYVRAQRFLLLFMGSVALLLILFGTHLLTFWMGPGFASQSVLVLQILAFGAVTGSLAPISGVLLQSFGRPDLVAKLYLFVHLPMTVALLSVLVTRIGIQGAAVVTALRTVVDGAVLLRFSQRTIRPVPRSPATGYLSAAGFFCAVGTLAAAGLAATGGVNVEPRWILIGGGAATAIAWYGVLHRLPGGTGTRAGTRDARDRRNTVAQAP